MNESFSRDQLNAVPEEVASWLLAAYGSRLAKLSLSLQGHYNLGESALQVHRATLAASLAEDLTHALRRVEELRDALKELAQWRSVSLRQARVRALAVTRGAAA
jgi:hypothetical protein